MAAPPLTRIPLAGGGQETLLSEVGLQYLLPLFTTRDACALRLVCREFLAAVSEQPWEDSETVIQGSLAAWRACFPRACAANVSQRTVWAGGRATSVVDADFAHLQGLRVLNMGGCKSVTDAAFAHLRGIHALDMRGCSQASITDAAFAHLRGVHTLLMSGCNQDSITDAAFVHLRGIHTLDMQNCSQGGITDAALAHLAGIQSLDLSYSSARITGRTFGRLAGCARLFVSEDRLDLAGAAKALGLPCVVY